MRQLKLICTGLIAALIALTAARQFFLQPLASAGSNTVWFGIQILPLAAVVPGIINLRARSYLLAALASTLYFAHGIMLAATPPLRGTGFTEAGLAMALLLAGSYAVRSLRATHHVP